MAAITGAVSFEAGGKGRTLQFTTNALCLLEEKLEKSTLDIATELQFNPRISTIRAMFWSGAGEHGMTLAAVGEMIDDLGLDRAIALAREAFAAAFPDREASVDENPPMAAAG